RLFKLFRLCMSHRRSRERAENEFVQLSSVKSPHIIKVLDKGVGNFRAEFCGFIELEVFSGVSLQDLLSQLDTLEDYVKATLAEVNPLHIARDAARGLRALHDVDRRLNDFAPANFGLHLVKCNYSALWLDLNAASSSEVPTRFVDYGQGLDG